MPNVRPAGQDETPITTAAGLRSSVENRWREAAKAAGRGTDLDAMRAIDPDLVEQASLLLPPGPGRPSTGSRGSAGSSVP
ncbi:MAG TPA: hypothetical protein VGQ26_01170 [Streptosporangiaceae bacterium]|nr:hypothetical protein [Streptosporangiaceae bacterium]